MLAGAATGTVEMRSITESIRDTNPKVNYLEATAMEVRFDHSMRRKTYWCGYVVFLFTVVLTARLNWSNVPVF